MASVDADAVQGGAAVVGDVHGVRVAARSRDYRAGQQRLQGGNSGRSRVVTAQSLDLHPSAAPARRACPDGQGGRR
jgi:hypothetical protein